MVQIRGVVVEGGAWLRDEAGHGAAQGLADSEARTVIGRRAGTGACASLSSGPATRPLPPSSARSWALPAHKLAMSGPNGDLDMPVEAGTEGEDDSFGEAGDLGGVLTLTFAF